ncbi:MAG TPA: hypothetical protein VHC69_01000 [Polyangiaceae bacterium]|nr:hypothetical protein [Polyangiaceae bacterium]
MRSTSSLRLLTIGFLSIGLHVACSSDKSPAGSSSSNSKADSGSKSSCVKPAKDGTCSGSTPILDQQSGCCLDQTDATSQCEANSASMAPSGTNVSDTSCGAGCTCTYCASEMFQCSTHPDCVKILLCAQAHNCVGTDCYTSGACTSLIDHSDNDAGISGDSVALAQLVNACATKTTIGTHDYTNRDGNTCMAGCQ